MLTSIGLLFFQSMGLKLEKVNLLGNEFHVQHTEFLPIALWIAFFYFIVRYYQYFHDLRDREIIAKYNERVCQNFIDRAFKRGKRKFKEGRKGDPRGGNFYFDEYEIKGILLGAWYADAKIEAPVSIVQEKADGSITSVLTRMEHHEKARWFVMLRIRLRAFLYVCLRTRFITEYYLPFLVASTPCLWWLINIRNS